MGGIDAIRSVARAVDGGPGAVARTALDDVAAPEIARAAARYAPKFGSMSVDDVARGRALVHDALEGLQVVPVVNRWAHPGGAAAIEHSDALMGTIHTLPSRGPSDSGMRVVRRMWERARDFHGEGPLTGRTVFASAQFVPRSSIARHGGDVVAGVDELAAARGGYGIARFGDQARIIDPRVLSRATVSARDSGLGLSPARVAPPERLDDVVLERLARSHGFQHDPLTGANDYRIGIDGVASDATRRASLQRLLHDTPDDVAVERLRGYLTSDAMTDINHMVEVQVRGVRGRNVLATRAERRAAEAIPVDVFDGPARLVKTLRARFGSDRT